MKRLIHILLLSWPGLIGAAELAIPDAPEPGSVSTAAGLNHWARIYEVASHPRCVNCHVGDSPYPMWSGPSFEKTQRHGMNVHAGASRIGAESLLCSTCHRQQNSDEPHGAPGAKDVWRLAPVEAAWFGKGSDVICQQLRDPARNGNRTFQQIASHLGHDVILHWAWNPGGKRQPAPHSLADHVADILAWGAAGMPCPGDVTTATEEVSDD
ncbi:hypothetical protein [Marinicella meishanensis]|uniref:hypothetical protein n=1 Tax=Marinicella meishanensis TaxID=2873263 RepID=UPI001CBE0274|nr:hypothetical protein [Marinicella sp. NBU2979]